MMEQMANAMPGDQLGEKKNGQASFPGLKSQQQSLKKMLEELISEMKNGNLEKGSKEKLGKFLQKQEMYRQNLDEMLQKGGLGNESEKILREVTKMLDQMESDISNFSINSSMIFRQNRIFSKLLEAENAHREKDFDKKRESKSGNIIKLSNPREIFEYKRVRSDFEGVFYDSNVKLFDYYNKLYLDYMIKLNND
jgi:small-conductance mechanosensitive channel